MFRKLFLVVRIASLALGAPQLAMAGNDEGLGNWTGDGVVFQNGRTVSTFKVEITRKEVGEKTVETSGKAVSAEGKVTPIYQRITRGEHGYKLESKRGQGGGSCFGAGLCQQYEDLGEGRGIATTIIVDSASKVRVLITELDQGQAVRFIRQELTKKQ